MLSSGISNVAADLRGVLAAGTTLTPDYVMPWLRPLDSQLKRLFLVSGIPLAHEEPSMQCFTARACYSTVRGMLGGQTDWDPGASRAECMDIVELHDSCRLMPH